MSDRKEISESAKALGSLGGKKRAQNLSKEQLSEIARKGAKKRWEKKTEDKKP